MLHPFVSSIAWDKTELDEKFRLILVRRRLRWVLKIKPQASIDMTSETQTIPPDDVQRKLALARPNEDQKLPHIFRDRPWLLLLRSLQVRSHQKARAIPGPRHLQLMQLAVTGSCLRL